MNGSIGLGQNLGFKECKPFKKGDHPLTAEFIKGYLAGLSGWKHSGKAIAKTFRFKDYYETIGFVNALAFIANRENHHPGLEVDYKTCKVSYSSHELGGLSENDFICATKIDELFKGPS
jgi:4a-hydroxytetrahydrobiopterin dehydratase